MYRCEDVTFCFDGTPMRPRGSGLTWIFPQLPGSPVITHGNFFIIGVGEELYQMLKAYETGRRGRFGIMGTFTDQDSGATIPLLIIVRKWMTAAGGGDIIFRDDPENDMELSIYKYKADAIASSICPEF
ncbi:MAG: hypothetical protein ACXV7G_11805 [Halobacteriota archaeon]